MISTASVKLVTTSAELRRIADMLEHAEKGHPIIAMGPDNFVAAYQGGEHLLINFHLKKKGDVSRGT